MEAVLAIVVGILFAASFYLLTSESLIRLLIGIVVLSNATHLLLFTAGGLTTGAPPFVPDEAYRVEGVVANPLPQALILTAIVISFSLFAFLLVLAYRGYQELGTVRTGDMRLAEPDEVTDASDAEAPMPGRSL